MNRQCANRQRAKPSEVRRHRGSRRWSRRCRCRRAPKPDPFPSAPPDVAHRASPRRRCRPRRRIHRHRRPRRSPVRQRRLLPAVCLAAPTAKAEARGGRRLRPVVSRIPRSPASRKRARSMRCLAGSVAGMSGRPIRVNACGTFRGWAHPPTVRAEMAAIGFAPAGGGAGKATFSARVALRRSNALGFAPRGDAEAITQDVRRRRSTRWRRGFSR